MDRRRFALSSEAEAMLTAPGGRWERVELADGPAAQAMVPGVRGRSEPGAQVEVPQPEERDDQTGELFG